QEVAMVAGRIARDGRAVLDVADHAALDRDADPGPHVDVVRESHLAGEEHVVSHARGAGDADHRRDEATLPDLHVVGDHDEVGDLGAPADGGVGPAPAVHRRVGTDLHVVSDDTAAHTTVDRGSVDDT